MPVQTWSMSSIDDASTRGVILYHSSTHRVRLVGGSVGLMPVQTWSMSSVDDASTRGVTHNHTSTNRVRLVGGSVGLMPVQTWSMSRIDDASTRGVPHNLRMDTRVVVLPSVQYTKNPVTSSTQSASVWKRVAKRVPYTATRSLGTVRITPTWQQSATLWSVRVPRVV